VVDVQCGFDYKPSSALNAQMSLRYCVAAALADGQVLPAQFSEQKMSDPALCALAERLDLVEDPGLDKLYPVHFAGWVSAKVDDQWMQVDILDPTGSVAKPVDLAAARIKFEANNPQLPVEAIAEMAMQIERHDARSFIDLLTPRQGRRAAA
jgi:2-methylcitrate dehydratase PrpD